MNTPDRERPRDDAAASPAVSTAPAAAGGTSPDVAPGHRWWSAIPRNLGRARTSTVLLGVLFLAVFALYLNVRPPAEGRSPAAGDPAVEGPATPTSPERTELTESEPPAPTMTQPRTTPDESSPTTRPATPSTTAPSPDTDAGDPAAPETTAPAPAGGADDGTTSAPTG